MTTIVGGICPRCGQFHDLFLAVDGSIVCHNSDKSTERIRQLEAEVAALREHVAAQQQEAHSAAQSRLAWVQAARREVLADLRAKVEGLPVFVTDMQNGTGPHYYEHTVLLSEVLALIDEAQP